VSAIKPRQLHDLADRVAAMQVRHFNGDPEPACTLPRDCKTCGDSVAIETGLRDAARQLAFVGPVTARRMLDDVPTRREMVERLRSIQRLAQKSLDKLVAADIALGPGSPAGDAQHAMRHIISQCESGRTQLDALLSGRERTTSEQRRRHAANRRDHAKT
jgi:hypothetical protein